MLRATLKSLLARKLRLGMSAFAVVLGVAFVTGSYVFTDTLNRTFSDLFSDLHADVLVRPAAPEGQDSFAALAGTTSVSIPADLVGEIAALPGVADAYGEIESGGVGVLDQDGDIVGVMGGPGLGVGYDPDTFADDSVVTVVDGRGPEGPGEVAIDARTVDKAGLDVGDEVDLVTLGSEPRLSAELVGVLQFGGDDDGLAGATMTAFDMRTAQELFLDGEDAYTIISVIAASDVSAEELRDTVAAVLPDSLEASTGADVDDEMISAVEEGLGFFNTFLLVFAAVALFVGIFMILNTFSILVAQRSREMALLRALGARRSQITRSVMIESFVVGLIGSTLGLAAGLGLARLMQVIFGALGMEFSGSLVLAPRTVIVAFAVGIVVTMVAALAPARRASKVPPVAAMRDDMAITGSSRRNHGLLGGLLTAAGVAAMVAGLADAVPEALLFVGLGILTTFVGVALLAPIISVPLIQVITGWYSAAFGTTGRLARQNAMRNPRRTAATASALMIGLALVSAIAVVGASTKKSIDEALDEGLHADFVITNNTAGEPFSPTVADSARDIAGVDTVTSIRSAFAVVEGSQETITAIEPDAFAVASDFDIVEGSGDLAGGGAVVGDGREDDVAIGDTVTIEMAGASTEVPVIGYYDSDSPLLSGGYIVGFDTFTQVGAPTVDTTVLVIAASGAELGAIETGLTEATAELPMVTVRNHEDYRQSQRDELDQLLNIVYALLGLAILVAILGIVNTLALSVMERTREVGLLRAVGLSRRQLRTTIRLESIAIAVLGAVLGIGLGLGFGISLQRALADEGLASLDVPISQLVVFLVLAAVVGILAAVWPARRAARLNVLRAITTE
ncbi:ABC transporter permease [Phytoactinopolyspora limicola]|uniref:ABC transporter permease n=1 Tax=Phytoactinopolyspora limicola TaxID=2715536 RepID=UPI001408FD2B|nr:FtsX-like permease family protein [Phytoactinopolyspora limicola]